MNAYVGFIVREKNPSSRDTANVEGVVDEHDANAALVWWGYRRGHKQRADGQRWVRWSELEVVHPAGATVEFKHRSK